MASTRTVEVIFFPSAATEAEAWISLLPVKDKYLPIVALLAPAICLILQLNSELWFGGYKFSYELLLLNAALTFLGLTLLIRRNK